MSAQLCFSSYLIIFSFPSTDTWSTCTRMNVTRGVWATPTSSRQPSTATGVRAGGRASAVPSSPTRPTGPPPCCRRPRSLRRRCCRWAPTGPRWRPIRRSRKVRAPAIPDAAFSSTLFSDPLILWLCFFLCLFLCESLTISHSASSSSPSLPSTEEEGVQPLPGVGIARLPAGALAGHSVAAVQAAAAQAAMAAQVAALEQLRDKLEAGEPPEKKMALPAEEHHRLLQRALQHNLLAMTAQLPMNIRINNQGTRKLHNTAAWMVTQILWHCIV